MILTNTRIATLVIGFIGVSFLVSFVRSDDGIAGKTGSPGEQTCTGCHTGNPLNASGGSVVISAPALANGQYFPGATYPISVTVSRNGAAIFGFGFEALRSTGANAGTLSITNPSQTQLKSVTIAGNSRTNVVHQLNAGATSAGTKTFSFNWTAPASGTGTVTFYAAGNATNGGGTTAGDFVYTTSLTLTESATGINENNDVISSITVYPNPVSEMVNIGLELSKNTDVKIRIYSVDGKLVDEPITEKLTSGTHRLEFSAPTVKGVYWMELEHSSGKSTEKIIVL
ncbi:MAG: choice-of-anchor V domain-containing protein [Bacteroidota bacterium]|jgi:hypothetical protein